MRQESLHQLFSLNTASGIPIYRQLIDQINQAIRMNLIKVNEQLPSVRSLAVTLQVNPMTISKAYAQLEMEGVLTRKRGIGMLVSKSQKSTKLSPTLEKSLSEFISYARTEKLSDEDIFALIQQYLSINNAG